MKTSFNTLLITGIIAMSALMTSCQSGGGGATSAVTCDKCKTVWLQRPVQVGPAGKTSGYTVLKSVKSMSCPGCEAAADTFFKTGSLKHQCAHCGGALEHCTAHGS